jgi:hypothetical protein
MTKGFCLSEDLRRSINAPPPGVAVDAICASTDTPVSSPDFCSPLVNSQNDANTLFAVGIYCGRGLWQVFRQQ